MEKSMESKDNKTTENNDKNIVENKDKKAGEDNALPTSNRDLSSNDSNQVKTIKVSNLSKSTSKHDLEEFLTFSGEIQYIEMQSGSETTQTAYVTFNNSKEAETALLLSGAIIASNSISVVLAENYKLPADAVLTADSKPKPSDDTARKAEDMVSSMLAKGFILGKDAVHKAQSLDEKHNLSTKASATVASIDNKIGLTEKISVGAAVVNDKVKEMDEKYNVSEKTKSAYAVAEQKATNAGSAIMSNPMVSTGASWLSSAFVKVVNVVGDVSTMTKEKVVKAEEDKKDALQNEQKTVVSDFAKFELDDSSVEDTPGGSPKSPNNKMNKTNQTNHLNSTDQTKNVDQVKSTDQTKQLDQAIPVNATTQTNPVNATTQAGPVNATTQTTPVNATTQSGPVNATTQTDPVNATTQTDPVNATTQTNTVNATTQADPVNATTQTNPVNATTQTEPVNATTQTNLINATAETNPVDHVKTTDQTKTAGSIDQTKATD